MTRPTFRPRIVLPETGVRAVVVVIRNLYRLWWRLVPRSRLFLGRETRQITGPQFLGPWSLSLANGHYSGEPERLIEFDAY